MPVFKKTKHHSIVEELVDQIQDAIVNGQFKPGDKLPASRDLEEMLGASRGTLREALRILEQKGLIEVKVGVKGGVFVREANTEPISDGLDLLIRQLKVSLDELSDFRQTVESGLVRRVTAMVDSEEIAELKSYIPELEKCVHMGADGWNPLLKTEVRLRKAMIRMSKSLMYEAVLIPIHENMFAFTDLYLPAVKSSLVEEAFEDWRIIIEAVSMGDAETAASRTREHISRFAQYLEEGRIETLERSRKAARGK